jgi:hypothetical protein
VQHIRQDRRKPKVNPDEGEQHHHGQEDLRLRQQLRRVPHRDVPDF